MNNMVNLDVLVVYSAGIAISASVDDKLSKFPFLMSSKQANYNLSYAYFLKICKRLGLKAGFTTSADIIGPGKCKSYWTIVSDSWVKMDNHAGSSQIFDKISPTTIAREAERLLLFSNETVAPFNDPELFSTFFDKLQTFKQLPDYAIPTVKLSSSKKSDIDIAVSKLRALVSRQRYSSDFSTKIVMKDRFGAGGNDVYRIDANFSAGIKALMLEHEKVSFVLQPFLKFDKGYIYKNNHTSTDLRLIFHRNKLLQCYVRMAKANDFRCNEHQGGQLTYVTPEDIPELVHTVSRKIVSKISKPRSLFALDFVMSNMGRAYFIEGNIGPGIDWDISKKINEIKSKELIRTIVTELSSRIHANFNPIDLQQRLGIFQQAIT